jgi:hypothetical protein
MNIKPEGSTMIIAQPKSTAVISLPFSQIKKWPQKRPFFMVISFFVKKLPTLHVELIVL